MNNIKAIFKHTWPLLVILILVIIGVSTPKDPASTTANQPSSATTARYTMEQVIELARSLSPDCRLQIAPTSGGSS